MSAVTLTKSEVEFLEDRLEGDCLVDVFTDDGTMTALEVEAACARLRQKLDSSTIESLDDAHERLILKDCIEGSTFLARFFTDCPKERRQHNRWRAIAHGLTDRLNEQFNLGCDYPPPE